MGKMANAHLEEISGKGKGEIAVGSPPWAVLSRRCFILVLVDCEDN
jgi:hypothetical protein